MSTKYFTMEEIQKDIQSVEKTKFDYKVELEDMRARATYLMLKVMNNTELKSFYNDEIEELERRIQMLELGIENQNTLLDDLNSQKRVLKRDEILNKLAGNKYGRKLMAVAYRL